MSKPIYENIPKLTIQQLKDRLNGKPYIHFVWEGKSYIVHVAYSACRFGGTRPWFICPHCQSRVGSLLFFNHQIGCRHCLNTCYASENKSPMDRQHQKEQKALAKLGVDKNRMYVAIAYEIESMLLTDEKYSNTASQIGAELAREGVVNKINGVKVITQDLGESVEYIVYATEWCQAIDEWKVNPVVVDLTTGSSEFIGASALKGRFVYEDVVTDAKAVIVKKTASE